MYWRFEPHASFIELMHHLPLVHYHDGTSGYPSLIMHNSAWLMHHSTPPIPLRTILTLVLSSINAPSLLRYVFLSLSMWCTTINALPSLRLFLFVLCTTFVYPWLMHNIVWCASRELLEINAPCYGSYPFAYSSSCYAPPFAYLLSSINAPPLILPCIAGSYSSSVWCMTVNALPSYHLFLIILCTTSALD